jgi:hypothetical protein
LKKGENSVEIEVVGTWMNRIIGDLQLPPEDRIVKTDNVPWQANSPLQASGLTGPVAVVAIER